jgi:hypothetical protein
MTSTKMVTKFLCLKYVIKNGHRKKCDSNTSSKMSTNLAPRKWSQKMSTNLAHGKRVTKNGHKIVGISL